MRPFIPAAVWALVILFLSTGSNIQLPESNVPSPDKLAHLFAYGLLAWLIFTGLRIAGKWSLQTALWTVAGVSLYGVSLEFVQWAFFPDRFFEVWDMIANITGACLSYLFYRFITNKT